MLPLAQWFMRGQGQALAFVTVCFSAGILFWPLNILAIAGLCLVTLRLGAQQGATIGLLALIPALFIGYQLGEALTPLLLGTSSLIVSQVLRQTRSWPFTLISLTMVSLGCAALMQTLFESDLAQQVEFLSSILQEASQQIEPQNAAQAELFKVIIEHLNTTFAAGIWGSMIAIMITLGIVIARSWQAKLYNPGGFQQEFHQLRLGKADTFLYMITGLGFLAIDASFMTWAWICFLPLTISAIALFHYVAKHKKLRQHWYVIFYMLLILSDFMRLFLVLIAVLDASINFRKQLKHKTD